MSFKTALSGLNAAQTDLDVISNNIANSETTGFKGSRTEFADVYANTFSGVAGSAPGAGVTVSRISQDFSQGNLEFTTRNLDLALEGQGFFVLNDAAGAMEYSRAGAYFLDRDGFVVNAHGSRLQGYPPTGNGNFSTGLLNDIQVNPTTGAPQATTLVDMGLNLDASELPPVLPFDPLTMPAPDPDSYNRSAATVVYDSLGVSHNLTHFFVKDPLVLNQWQVYSYVENPVTGAGQELTPSGQTINFLPDGTLSTAMPLAYAATGYIGADTGANELTLNMDFTDSTQYGSAFTLNNVSQDGFTTGRLSSIDVDDEGTVSARFTNGQFLVLARVALANFASPDNLAQLGDTAWGDSFAAGDVILGEAMTGQFGAIHSGALEGSNVDIAEELVNLIVAQRNYQANAQSISTEDQITQTIINLR